MRNSIQHLYLKISVLSLSLLFLAYPAQSQESSASHYRRNHCHISKNRRKSSRCPDSGYSFNWRHA